MSGRTRLVGALGALTVAGVIVGCAPAVDAAWTPPQWPAAELRVVTAPPAPLDPAAVPGLAGQRLRHDGVGVQARFAYLPGTSASVTAFNGALDAAVRAVVDSRAASVGAAYQPTVFSAGAGLGDRGCVMGSTLLPASQILADPDVGPAGGAGAAVVCDIVTAAGSMLGERVRVVSGGPDGVTSDVSTILFVDTATGVTTTGAEMWTDAAAAVLGADVVEALRRDAGALSNTASDGGGGAQLEAVRAALSTTLPTAQGTLVFTIASGFTTPELTELGLAETVTPLTVEVPADIAAPLLTDAGRALLAASALPYAGPADVPAGTDWVNCRLVPCVAVTYDDGPSGYTPTLLDELAAADAAATFYMLGGVARGRPDTVARVSREGHEIGTHTWNHPRLPTLDDAAVAREIGDSRGLLQQLSGQPISTFRPPYGEYTARDLAIAGLPAILWSVDTRDWAGPADDVLIRAGVDQAKPGGIVLFHDIHERSVRVAPAVFAGLQDRGFTLATIDQLFGGAAPAAGAWRSAPQ